MKSTVFGFQRDAIIASYFPKTNRVVNVLSTMHSQPEIESTSDQKPSIIVFHNKTKDGVGTLDRMLRSYSIKRMTRRWPLVLFYNMIDLSTINAFMQGINHGDSFLDNIYVRRINKISKLRCRTIIMGYRCFDLSLLFFLYNDNTNY